MHVVDLTNGARLETYVIPAPAGSGEIQINGAAAHLVNPGDMVIIMAYEGVPEDRLAEHRPRIVLVDELNRVAHLTSSNLVNGARPVELREPVAEGARR